jgi:hypothetical protein
VSDRVGKTEKGYSKCSVKLQKAQKELGRIFAWERYNVPSVNSVHNPLKKAIEYGFTILNHQEKAFASITAPRQ